MIYRVIRVGRDHVTIEVELPDCVAPPPEILDRLDRLAGLTPVTHSAAAAAHSAAGTASAGRVMGARPAPPPSPPAPPSPSAAPQGTTAVDTILAREYPPDA